MKYVNLLKVSAGAVLGSLFVAFSAAQSSGADEQQSEPEGDEYQDLTEEEQARLGSSIDEEEIIEVNEFHPGRVQGELDGDLRMTAFGRWTGPTLFLKEQYNLPYITVDPVSGSMSVPYEIPEGRTLQFMRMLAQPNEEGETHIPVGNPVTIPEGIEQPLLLMTWDQQRKVPQALVFNMSEDAIPNGTYYVINFSSRVVGLEFTDVPPQPINPGDAMVVDPGIEGDNVSVGIQLLAQGDDGRLIPSRLSNMTVYSKNRRTLIFVRDDETHSSGVTHSILLDYRDLTEEERANLNGGGGN